MPTSVRLPGKCSCAFTSSNNEAAVDRPHGEICEGWPPFWASHNLDKMGNATRRTILEATINGSRSREQLRCRCNQAAVS